MITLERLQLVKVMITQLDVYQINPIKKYYKLIAIDFSKQQKLENKKKAIQQINFTRDLTRKEVARIYFIIEEASQAVQYEQLKYYDYILFWYNVSIK